MLFTLCVLLSTASSGDIQRHALWADLTGDYPEQTGNEDNEEISQSTYAKVHDPATTIFTLSNFGARHSLDRRQTSFCNVLGLQERCWRSRALRVTLQRESEIACICPGDFVYFVVNKISYFSVSRPGPLLTFACTDSYYAYKMTKCIQIVIEVQKIQ